MTQRYKITMAYDGTMFAGFQIQDEERTVQGDLQRVLTKIAKGKDIKLHGSGRTDSGVHALAQVAHFDFPFELSEHAMERALNTSVADDLSILKVEKVGKEFHARFSAVEKTYLYRIHNSPIRDPFRREYCLWHPYSLDCDRLQRALERIEGEHDFTSFTSTKSPIQNKVRTIYEAALIHNQAEEEIDLIFRGNGFLYNMVRVLVGSLIEIGDGRKPVEEIDRLFACLDRNQAGPTAAAHGLYLKEVNY